MREERDLLEDRDGRWPAHATIRDFRFEGTDLAAVIWLGNENSGADVDVMLTRDDVEWFITALQRALTEVDDGKG